MCDSVPLITTPYIYYSIRLATEPVTKWPHKGIWTPMDTMPVITNIRDTLDIKEILYIEKLLQGNLEDAKYRRTAKEHDTKSRETPRT